MGAPRICFVVSSPMTVEAFLLDHLRALSRHYEVHLVLNDEPRIRQLELAGVTVHTARITRAIAPVADIRGLVMLFRLFRRLRFSAVHSITPKAGLLTALAAWAARVPVRIHTYTGQVWVTRQGVRR